MLYKFRSKAGGDVIMLGPDGDRLLGLLGRAASAKGIIEPEAMPEAIARLRAAVQDEGQDGEAPDGGKDGQDEVSVGLRRRLWPMLELLQRAQNAGHPVVWGV